LTSNGSTTRELIRYAKTVRTSSIKIWLSFAAMLFFAGVIIYFIDRQPMVVIAALGFFISAVLVMVSNNEKYNAIKTICRMFHTNGSLEARVGEEISADPYKQSTIPWRRLLAFALRVNAKNRHILPPVFGGLHN